MKHILFTLLCVFSIGAYSQKTVQVQSPDKQLSLELQTGEELILSLKAGDELLLAPSEIGIELSGKSADAHSSRLKSVKKNASVDKIHAHYYKKDRIEAPYNEAVVRLKDGNSLVLRCYNDGVAYRFIVDRKGDYQIKKEIAQYCFPEKTIGYAAYSNQKKAKSLQDQYFNSFENRYDIQPIGKLNQKRLTILPFLAEVKSGKKVCVMESGLKDYPGMFLHCDGSSMTADFAAYPKTTKQGGHNMLQELILTREDYIAKANGQKKLPWRIFAVADKDEQLLDNDLVYTLGEPVSKGDFSWVKPGKVAWDWWNDWNLENVNFKTGVNNQTYKYYIDFASRNGIEYVILDEGWAVNKKADLLQVVPEIDLKELVTYAESKKVGLILWAGFWAFRKDMEKVAKHYHEMGFKGFKIDFLDRDDQQMIQFMWDAARVCADNQMMVDFHGCCKPFGLQRTYPNVVNYEGVFGLEQMKWSSVDVDHVTYDVTFPFIRMAAGFVDYTQGAMRNSAKGCYRPINNKPMSQGTRCHQLAEYVVFDSPLNMMCDAPTAYEKEPVCTKFISQVPTVWDQTVALPSKVTEYISIARRKGDVWYVGALNNWNRRNMTLDLSFLGDGNYEMEVMRDGINADKSATDFVREFITVPADRKVRIQMAQGGGWIARIVRK